MRSTLLLLACFLSLGSLFAQPCTISNATGCDCLDGSNDCDLLPDMKVSRDLLLDASQNTEIPGELGVSVSTPNVGHGPLRVISTDYYLCDTDTIHSPGGMGGACPDGTQPSQLIKQIIYHKNPDGTMSNTERWAGSMTYHPSHGHMHVDDWGVYSLREEVPGTDPTTWPILAEGSKLGFCLMDYGSCTYYNGHCRDAADNILTTDAPNYGLGGGSYSCGTSNQGISAGYTDIYGEYLDGMQIPIPPTMCNGDYMLVVEIDPNDNFLEEDETNNVMVVPVTLTEQNAFTDFEVDVVGSTVICAGEMVELSVPFAVDTYSWSNGATSSSIMVSDAGTYSVTVTNDCGTVTSDPVLVEVLESTSPLTTSDTLYGSGVANLTATGDGDIDWYDAATGGTLVGSGSTFSTPVLTATTTYYAENITEFPGGIDFGGQENHSGASTYSGPVYNSYLIFDAYTNFTLKSVKVYTDLAGTRDIEVRSSDGTVLATTTVNCIVGEQRIALDFEITPGSNYLLSTNTSANLTNFGFESPRFQRSSSGVSLPYVTSGVFSIHDTEFGEDYYYYFYDWEVEEDSRYCGSTREAAEAVVINSTGLDALADVNNLQLSPNPAADRVQLSFEMTQQHDLTLNLFSVTGQRVYSEFLPASFGTVNKEIDLSGFAAGIYTLELTVANESVKQKLIISK